MSTCPDSTAYVDRMYTWAPRDYTHIFTENTEHAPGQHRVYVNTKGVYTSRKCTIIIR